MIVGTTKDRTFCTITAPGLRGVPRKYQKGERLLYVKSQGSRVNIRGTWYRIVVVPEGHSIVATASKAHKFRGRVK